MRQAVVDLAERCGMTADAVGDARLAVSEAATNAVIHAYRERPGQLRLHASVERGELKLVIADDGDGLLPRTDSPGLGLGLPIMSAVSERCEVVSGPDGTEIHLAFRCPAAA
jgi:serine/threonine-protein kinase RsbW/stage II sporulation protein AB (anti-sigma F factor)